LVYGQAYGSVRINEPYIAMTFDDGPSFALTPKLLDILKARNIKVTFFILGSLASRYPDIVKRIAEEGHEVADHTWDHTLITKLTQSGLDHQVIDTANVLRSITGKWPRVFRPPYGGTSPTLNKIIRAAYNMKVILWSVDPDDWKRPGPAVVAQRLIDGARSGAIMLAHDIQPGTIEAAPQMFDTLLAKGFKFVTVSQLLDLAKIEDVVGNEHPGAAGDTLNDGGAKGTGVGGNQAWRDGRDASGGAQPQQPPQPRQDVPASASVPCLSDSASLVDAQKILIAKGLLAGPAGETLSPPCLLSVLLNFVFPDGSFGPKSRAALQAWAARNNVPGAPTCVTAALLSALRASQ
jgi:peptidoglycan/xylan/chitin deacetylase (PgdA/CDA1 family)